MTRIIEMADFETRQAVLTERLQELHPSSLVILDESHLHAGHAGAQGGAKHLRVKIAAAGFTGLSHVARHRLVYDRLRDLIPHPIHALALETQAS